jgi:NAD(P)-dependent dehydrogenase (short-subunit alcohol dehydrogenase family)
VKTVLITGCATGFGRDLVPLFLQDGWRVIATMRRMEERKSIFAGYDQSQLTLLELDITCAEHRVSVLHYIEHRLGGQLDCLVNNAGFGLFGAHEDVSESELRNQFEVNFFGQALLTQLLLPAIRSAKGRIINLSSILGYSGLPLTSAYCASKHALEGWSEALAFELAEHGVQVCLVEPGGHRTNFGQNIKWGTREESKAYKSATTSYRRLLARKLSSRGVPSQEVSRRILSLSMNKKMPIRIPIGRDAVLLFMMKKLIPSGLMYAIQKAVYRKMFAHQGHQQPTKQLQSDRTV